MPVGAVESNKFSIGRPARQRRSTSRNSSAVWKRSCGDFASDLVSTCSSHSGRPSRAVRTGVGGSLTCDWREGKRRFALERQFPGCQPIENDAQRVKIGASIDLVAEHCSGAM